MILGVCLLGSLLSGLAYEYYNYTNYKKMVSVVESTEPHIDHKRVDHKWMENFWLNELDKDGLLNWIKKTTSYVNNPTRSNQPELSTSNQPELSAKPNQPELSAELNQPELSTSNQTELSVESNDKYYKDVSLEDLSRKKMLDWTAYHMYFKPMMTLEKDELDNVDRILSMIEKKIDHIFIDDNNINDDNIFFLSFGENKIETTYTPAIMYGGLSIIKNISYTYLKYYGFKKYKTNLSDMVYFYYNNPNCSKTTIFIHGLGIGITPYMNFILGLIEHTNLIVLILPNVSNMEYNKTLFPTYNSLREDVTTILDLHNIERVNMIGHSFGTIIMGILFNEPKLKNRIDKKVFIDPVCFIDESYKIFRYINEPDCRDGGIVNNVFNMLVYKDIYVRYATQRFLYGPEFWIFDYESLNDNNSLVILCTNDQMVPSQSIYERLKKYNVPCVIVNDAQHADVFTNTHYMDVLDKVKSYIILYFNNVEKIENISY
ncbi:MAG: alpha/beta hydrolase fold [Homavirus sp.]|uniref:Alpha/beta hydrolase fold n=1 Tax=Homavirus sp. TaxID=2487769 RepID=A0A3G5A4S7_9VIRU|nr:MAG: alpha/beta hydrolase fold [Homavirus sp.]